MSVKSPAQSTIQSPNQIQTSPGSPSLHGVNRDGSTSADKETDTEDGVIDFSNGKIMASIGYLMCLIILGANVYVLVTL